ncbi:Gfo/Idh/MocA family protein [Turneriella parva]|uniref:Oxidoreductase domain protein n=1 Tax=Turneriella parva (strain ATCC BAA-1111 / DSM 21527 / NCTC 11395 / H) TaxID=869212 RepID=I4B1T7_TURPD|nr:Gfo/Idh/MocA family oxidoreductase [Turneriella parva]AFM11244.1 oxidoreductase domain protein [Turneriella parva DSM 21527]
MRVAIVGCGRIAHELESDALRYKPCTHLGALKNLQRRDRSLQVIGFCDAAPERAVSAAGFMRADGARVTTDYKEILDLEPELLIIAASTAIHHKILLAAIAAGVNRIVAEKPLVTTKAEVSQLRRAIQSSKSVILPNYERRYHDKYIALQRLIQNERRSPAYRAFFAAGGSSLYADKKSSDEGVLLHDTTHLVDLAQFLFGTVTAHRVIAGERRHLLYLKHKNGSEGIVETSLGVGAFHLELQVMRQNERITVGNGFTQREKIVASPHYRRLRGYAPARRTNDKPMTVAINPFMRLYREALYGKPDNGHFFDALANVEMLYARRSR